MSSLIPRSLFVVALPRSLSTHVHGLCCRSLGLRSPSWADAGEVLNGDRILLLSASQPHFLPAEAGALKMMSEFLDDAVRSYGRVYKDVVQPFVVSRWLEDRRLADKDAPAVLHVRRPLADIAWSMKRANWRYPERAGGVPRAGEEPDDRLLRGLLRARTVLEKLSGAAEVATVEFDEVLRDEQALPRALRKLYPAAQIREVTYLDAAFQRRRDAILARRRGDDWRRLAVRLEEISATER
ncbi:MAG: hypothetical protein AAFY88_15230 [Acidobacteriota bacterium]